MWIQMMTDYSGVFIDAKERVLGQAEVTRGLWDDEVQRRFYDQYVDKSILAVDRYLDGHDSYAGKGLRDLTAFVNEKISEFNTL